MCLNLQKSLQILLMESLIHIALTKIGWMRNNVCNCRNHRKADGSRVYWWISKTEVFSDHLLKNLILTAWRKTSIPPRFVAAGVQSLARVPCLSVPRRPRRPCLGLLTMWSTFSGKKESSWASFLLSFNLLPVTDGTQCNKTVNPWRQRN